MFGFVRSKKTMFFLLLIFIIILICSYLVRISSQQFPNKYISKILEINIPKDVEIKLHDTHGGFHGDGTAFAKINFDDEIVDDIRREIEENDHWNKLPLSENINLIMYGGMKGNRSYGYRLAEEVGIPMVQNGYWIFIDRNGEKNILNDDSELFDRYSFNFTIAIYDTDKNILYYFELDT